MTDKFEDMANARGSALNGRELLNELMEAYRKYVILPSEHAYRAAALHVASTHGQPAWYTAPRFQYRAPEKRSGKTRAQTVHRYLSYKPLQTVNISPAALARTIGTDDPPTLHMDEYDTYFGSRNGDKHEDLRGIINSGFERGGSYTRWDMMARQLEQIPTFCMVTLAGIGELPDTVADRSVTINMRRRARGEEVAPFRARHKAPLEQLGQKVNLWVRRNLQLLKDVEPDLPVEDRAADVWEPLIAIADLAGGEWVDLGREACVALTGERKDTTVPREVELLRDLHIAFGDDESVHTAVLIDRLSKLDESLWRKVQRMGGAEFITPTVTDREISKVLQDYDHNIRSAKIRKGDVVKQGYKRADLEDAWRRHCTCGGCSGS
ncbi:DUF3631 domain-containing protein [Micromonospora aurantiaca]|uniref:DUF3631 domain-containing protein n=1 Tax=Micromonospora aurantiaca (nom. illeg.) TaxID=47850 RepID=UPI0034059C2D